MADLQYTEGGKVLKMEVDYAETVEKKLPECEALVEGGKINEALEILMTLEKQTRTDGDSLSTSRILVAIVKMLFESGNFQMLNDNIVLLSKRRSQIKTAMTKMIQECCTYVDKIEDKEKKLALINTLLEVTSGKIHVEIERARLTHKLAQIYEAEGKISEAATVMQELQVETFGSMEKREKVELILEQMRYSLAKEDYIKTQIISRKILPKYFTDEAIQDLKLKFYGLMIKLDQHDGSYLKICKHYRAIFETPIVKQDMIKKHEALKNIVLYVVLAPYDNEQSDMIHRIKEEKALEELPSYQEIIKKFTINELIDWRVLMDSYKDIFRSGTPTCPATAVFSIDEDGEKRWVDLKNRIIEHNIRVMAKYYRRLRFNRMAELLGLCEEDTEEFLSNLVVSKTIWAKVDRLEGIVNFEQHKDPNEVLNDWSHDINKLMNLVCKVDHLINKEEMIHQHHMNLPKAESAA